MPSQRIDKTPQLVRHCLGICPQADYLKPEEIHIQIIIYRIQKKSSYVIFGALIVLRY